MLIAGPLWRLRCRVKPGHAATGREQLMHVDRERGSEGPQPWRPSAPGLELLTRQLRVTEQEHF